VPCCFVRLSCQNDHTDVLFERIHDDDDDEIQTAAGIFTKHLKPDLKIKHMSLAEWVHLICKQICECVF